MIRVAARPTALACLLTVALAAAGSTPAEDAMTAPAEAAVEATPVRSGAAAHSAVAPPDPAAATVADPGGAGADVAEPVLAADEAPPRPRAATVAPDGRQSAFAPAAAVATAPRAEVLVRFRDGASDQARQRAHARAGALGGRQLRLAGWERATLAPGADPHRVAAGYRRDPDVEEAEVALERRISAIPRDLLVQQWAYHNIGQTIFGSLAGTPDADIDAPEAWDLVTGSKEIVVAVLDTGVDTSREDLSSRLVAGFDFANGDSNPNDDNGHGTAVASVIGAIGNNTSGMTGLNWKVSIMPIKICTAGGTCPTSAILNGIDFARNNGADVINMSLSCDENFNAGLGCPGGSPGDCFSSAERMVIQQALADGVVVVNAAGNCGSSLDDSTRSYPCAHDMKGNICVGATDPDDDVASFSNRGTQTVDLGAPGDWIPVYDITPPGGIYFTAGTSFSSPIVAGAAALLLSRTTLTPEAVRERLVEGTDDGQILPTFFEHGRLNAFKTVRRVFLTGLIYGSHAPGDVTLLADVTGDGLSDLVNGTAGVGISVAKNVRKNRKFGSMNLRSSTPPGDFTGAGDVNGDGREDIVLGSATTGFGVLLSKNGKGALLPVASWSTENLGNLALVGDVNGDGRADVVNDTGTFDVMLSTGTAFGAPAAWSSESPGDFTMLADADGDGRADLIFWNSSAGTTTVSVALAGTSSFASSTDWADFDMLDLPVAGDFDGDGDADLAGADPGGVCIRVALSDGSKFESPEIWTCAGSPSHLLAGRADRSADLRVDLVSRQASTGTWLMLASAP